MEATLFWFPTTGDARRHVACGLDRWVPGSSSSSSYTATF